MIFNWIPLKSIGPFKFDDNIKKYIKPYSLKDMGDYDNIGRITYKHFKTDTNIYVEEGKIVSVNCRESCILEGVELIGLRIEKFIEIVKCKPEDDVDTIEMPSGGIQDVYEFDDLGAQVWVDKDTGTIVTIICGPEDEEDE